MEKHLVDSLTMTRLYFAQRQSELKAKRQMTSERLASLGQLQRELTAQTVDAQRPPQRNEAGTSSTTISQVDSNIVDRVLRLANLDRSWQTRKQLAETQLTLIQQQSALDAEILRTEETLKALASPQAGEPDAELRRHFEAKLGKVVDDLNKYWVVVNNIYRQISLNGANSAGTLFTTFAVDRDIEYFHPVLRSQVAILLVSLVIGAFLVTLVMLELVRLLSAWLHARVNA